MIAAASSRCARFIARSAPGASTFLARGGLSFALNISGTGLSFLLSLVVGRLFGAAGLGLFGYMLALTLIVSSVGALGFDLTFVRFFASLAASREASALKALLRTGLARTAMASALISAAVIAAAWIAPAQIGHGVPFALAAALIAAPVWALQSVLAGGNRGLGEVVSALAPDLVVKPIMMILVAVVACFVASELTERLLVAGLGFIAAGVAALAWSAATMRRRFDALDFREGANRPAPGDVEAWSRCSHHYWLQALIRAAHLHVELMLTITVLDAAAAGAVFVLLRLAGFVWVWQSALVLVSGPTFSAHHRNGQSKELERVAQATNLLGFAGSVAIGAPLMSAPSFFLGLFGPEFGAYAPHLAFLVGGYVLASLGGAAWAVLNMTGHEALATRLFGWSVAIQIIVALVAVPLIGVWGVALAKLASIFVLTSASCVAASRFLGVRLGVVALRSSRLLVVD